LKLRAVFLLRQPGLKPAQLKPFFADPFPSTKYQPPANTPLPHCGLSKIGKGYIFAVGDPWLYNEYIDHWVLPKDFDNLKAAKNLVKLLLK